MKTDSLKENDFLDLMNEIRFLNENCPPGLFNILDKVDEHVYAHDYIPFLNRMKLSFKEFDRLLYKEQSERAREWNQKLHAPFIGDYIYESEKDKYSV